METTIKKMTVDDIVSKIEQESYCVVEGVIPADKVGAIRTEVVATQRAHHEEAEAELAKTRSRGHRIGTPGCRAAQAGDQCYAVLRALPCRRAHSRRGRTFLRRFRADFLHGCGDQSTR